MHRTRKWIIPEPDPDAAARLAGALRTSPLLAQILLNRGMSDPAECAAFLRPSLKSLHEPGLIPNLTRAAERIAKAIADKEKIVIYGDYDVDGITATTILWHAITMLGGVVDYYIPHRIDEGYGLNAEAIGQICDEGARLIVTVDCGVTAAGPAKVACERGVDLIITDHHEWTSADGQKPDLPECFTVVHPRLPGETRYPNECLCGAGVAFKLAWAVGQAVNGAAKVSAEFRDFLVEATALAALGTIADVVPLKGENRILAHFGLTGLQKSKLRGVRALIESAGLTGQNLDAYHVGFLLAPRLNACGRMGHAREAVEMLTRADFARATEIATYLESQNRERQAMERNILEQALAQVKEKGFDKDECCGIVLGAEGWHPGVIGIVASRIVDRFHRPTIMVALNNGHGQGSGRSIAGFHLADALTACTEYLEGHGGHEMAAGLKVKSDNFEAFRSAFCAHAAKVLNADLLTPQLRMEAVAPLSMINLPLVTDLRRLGPFGHGNRKPLLCCRDVVVAGPPRRVGKTGDHLQFSVRQENTVLKCIAFKFGELAETLKSGSVVHLAAEPAINEFGGRTSVELEVKDIQIAAIQGAG